MPNVIGWSADEAKAEIRDADMTARTKTIDAAGTAAGEVIKQSPRPGETERVPVDLTVASGKVAVSADEIIGLTYTKASAALEKLGFAVARKNVTQSADAGQVVAFDRSGRLPGRSTITLSVAVAPAPSRSALAIRCDEVVLRSECNSGKGSSAKGTAKARCRRVVGGRLNIRLQPTGAAIRGVSVRLVTCVCMPDGGGSRSNPNFRLIGGRQPPRTRVLAGWAWRLA